MTKRHKVPFESAIHGQYLYCGDEFILNMSTYVMSKLIRWHTLKLYSLLYLNYTSVKLFKNKWNSKYTQKISPEGDQNANVYHFLFTTLHLKH